MRAEDTLGPLWNGYVVLLHATMYLAGLALLLPLMRRKQASERAALHAAALVGTLAVSALCFLPVGFWWAWLLPEMVAAPLLWIGATGVASNGTTLPRGLQVAAALYLGWMAGALFMLVRLGFAWIVMYALTRRAVATRDPSWARVLRDASSSMGTGQVAALRFSDAVSVPVVWGFLNPTIVLPASAHDWPPEQRRMVLLHELAHIRRADMLVQGLGALTRALYWFHPAVLWSLREQRDLREEAADALVLGCGVKRSEYASCLLQVAGAVGARGLPERAMANAALAMAQHGALPRRIRRILGWSATPALGRWTARVVCTACCLWVLVLGSVRLAPQRDVVVAALSSADWAKRGYAARLLGRTRIPAIRAMLDERAAHDPSPVVRRIAGYRYSRTP